jgi:hypothetical protein
MPTETPSRRFDQRNDLSEIVEAMVGAVENIDKIVRNVIPRVPLETVINRNRKTVPGKINVYLGDVALKLGTVKNNEHILTTAIVTALIEHVETVRASAEQVQSIASGEDEKDLDMLLKNGCIQLSRFLQKRIMSSGK